MVESSLLTVFLWLLLLKGSMREEFVVLFNEHTNNSPAIDNQVSSSEPSTKFWSLREQIHFFYKYLQKGFFFFWDWKIFFLLLWSVANMTQNMNANFQNHKQKMTSVLRLPCCFSSYHHHHHHSELRLFYKLQNKREKITQQNKESTNWYTLSCPLLKHVHTRRDLFLNPARHLR